jgi:hypothetical protein
MPEQKPINKAITPDIKVNFVYYTPYALTNIRKKF